MNKVSVSISLLASTFLCFGQLQVVTANNTSVNNNLGSQAVFYNLKSGNKVLSYDDISGSPYPTKSFYNAKISGVLEPALVRYNSYNDEIEFKKEDNVLALPKRPEYSKIEIISQKQIIVLLDTTDELTGYFYELVNGKNYLYKKIKTKFTDIVPAPNGYASDKPASFRTLDPVYYIKTDTGFIKKPKNQKDIIAQFPDKKESLNTFFKSNKIKFDKEEDLIKLVTFLNQN